MQSHDGHTAAGDLMCNPGSTAPSAGQNRDCLQSAPFIERDLAYSCYVQFIEAHDGHAMLSGPECTSWHPHAAAAVLQVLLSRPFLHQAACTAQVAVYVLPGHLLLSPYCCRWLHGPRRAAWATCLALCLLLWLLEATESWLSHLDTASTQSRRALG